MQYKYGLWGYNVSPLKVAQKGTEGGMGEGKGRVAHTHRMYKTKSDPSELCVLSDMCQDVTNALI